LLLKKYNIILESPSLPFLPYFLLNLNII
jgi:hypothetical protein